MASRLYRVRAISAALLVLVATGALAQTTPPPAVVVTPAEMTEVRESGGFTGRAAAQQRVDIRARVVGFLEAMNFQEGGKVKQGDVLYRIEDADYRAAVAAIEGSIQSAQAQLDLAKLEQSRKTELVQRQAVAQNELDVATAQVGQASGQLAQLQASLDQAKLQLSYTEITAPFDGIIGLSSVDVGALVGPDSGALTTLTKLDPIYVTFPVATATVLDYQRRMADGTATGLGAVHLTLPDGVAYDQTGTLDFIAPDVATGTDTILIRAEFPNPKGTLRDQALVNVTLEDKTPVSQLTVPQQAVQRDQMGAFVLVVDAQSKVELRRVETGLTDLGRVVISSGLKEGENVIVDGINKVRPGITVDAATGQAG
ncbi:MAG: efflux RND transporter periplasmic adaptor subunit [Rhodovulum sulfidophilum]|uniref:Efflux RND transporter periplasmic adaptor subunit n=1 Tax=Rhodovulum sulfidophilum TaxID=35806 RepID=A0A2W5N7X7_RHOSU|nr:MAG: efflux RND transporter periplasmic adaptor subunit [Rhodovulum sulfidophilum]